MDQFIALIWDLRADARQPVRATTMQVMHAGAARISSSLGSMLKPSRVYVEAMLGCLT